MEVFSPNGLLGVVTEGSFSAGLTVRLNDPIVEDLQVGSFVVLEGERNKYFSLIGDLQLRVTDPGVTADPPLASGFVRKTLHGIHSYAAAVVRPSLVIEDQDDVHGDPQPKAVRTIPAHFSQMRTAYDEDFNLVFGEESRERFAIGSPIASDHVNIPIDLVKLIERSNGIFGQTGTGKSVLARLLLFGLIKSDLASTLIFDMHDEYADTNPRKQDIPGLRELFKSSQVKVYKLDQKSHGSDPNIQIGMNQIDPEDIELLSDELDLKDTFFATSYLLQKHFGDRWLSALLDMDANQAKEFSDESGAHQGAVDGLRRKLMYLKSCEYIIDSSTKDPVSDILGHIQQGRHVIVQFGRHSRLRDYMLVANLLTRRIHQRYTERSAQVHNGSADQQPLVVVLEEAHKFLSPAAARQSIFGTIAREMRKFGVSLLVVDQRPSGIDNEIVSQLGTRITGLLTDASDIEAVLSGTGDRSALRAMLASLEPSRQCLVVGHAIPMPMILQTREYSRKLEHLLEARAQVSSDAADIIRKNPART